MAPALAVFLLVTSPAQLDPQPLPSFPTQDDDAHAVDPELDEPDIQLPPLGTSMRQAYGAAGLAALLGLALLPGAAVATLAGCPLAFAASMFLGLACGPFVGGAVAGAFAGGLLGAFSALSTGAAAMASWPGDGGTTQTLFVALLAGAHLMVVAPLAALVPTSLVAVPAFLLLAMLLDYAAFHGGSAGEWLASWAMLGGAGVSGVVLVLAALGTVGAVVVGGALSPALAVWLGRALTTAE